MAYTVEQRNLRDRRSHDSRADREQVMKMVLRGAFSQIGIGLTLGIPTAIAAGRLMSDQLSGVKRWDPIMLALAVLLASAIRRGVPQASSRWRRCGTGERRSRKQFGLTSTRLIPWSFQARSLVAAD